MSQSDHGPVTDRERLRRRYPRVQVADAMLVEASGELSEEEFAVTRDLGLGGCSFVSAEPYQVGAYLRILITVAGRVIESRGRVAYANRNPDGRSELGVEFVQIATADRAALAASLR